MNTFVCGANSYPAEGVVGKKLKEVVEMLREVLNPPAEPDFLIGGKPVTGDHVLAEGEDVEVKKEIDDKG